MWVLQTYVRNPASGLLQICRKLEKWQWRHNLLTWRHRQFFDVILLLLSSLVSGPSFMGISSMVLELWQFTFIRDWPEIGNTLVWVLLDIWRLGRVRDPKLCKDVSDEMLLNVAKCQGYGFYCFWVIKENLTGGEG